MLQKQISRTVKGKQYVKWVIVVPPKLIRELGWVDGQELSGAVSEASLVVKKREKGKNQT
jgi:hypothetical protein